MLWCPLVYWISSNLYEKWKLCLYKEAGSLWHKFLMFLMLCSLFSSKVMAGQIVMRWLKDLSRKQMVGSQWSCKRKKFSRLMSTFWSWVWTPTQGTRGLLSSGSTASSAAFLVIPRRTITSRKSAQVNKEPKDIQRISVWICKISFDI